jgi:hypothetical protein
MSSVHLHPISERTGSAPLRQSKPCTVIEFRNENGAVMTGIGGPGGVGPKGPVADHSSGATGASDAAGEVHGNEASSSTSAARGPQEAQRSGAAAGLQGLDALAGEIAAGRLTPKQAVDFLVDAAGAQLEQAERAELRELLDDLFANDPHLRNLIDGIGRP